MDIDGNLAQLAAAPLPDLSAIDGGALAVRARAEVRHSRSTLAVAMAASLGIGVVGGMQAPAKAEVPLAAFGPSLALAPLIALGQE
ncbi:MAG: hypothetical protein NBV68_00020 [Erythrobacter sp.]|uniref:hypothetical protein n=1 Tax=Erythrobacter sp. TaxID=1042 RepID=UPI0025FDB701|nr:hypothetical protein [Erythrobacter sp.]MCL9997741.1 hypothetical protein [Erythrobacter sp.]